MKFPEKYIWAILLFILATVIFPFIAKEYFGINHDTDIVHGVSVILGIVIGVLCSNIGIILAGDIRKEKQ